VNQTNGLVIVQPGLFKSQIKNQKSKIICLWAALALAGAISLTSGIVRAEEKLKAPRAGKAIETVALEARASMLNGSPAAGVKVTFCDVSFGHRGGKTKERTWPGITDDKGILRIEVPTGEVGVSASCRVEPDRAAKFAPCSISMPQGAFASRDMSRKAEILLAPATSGLKGTVTARDGKPIAGVTIDLELTGDHGKCSYQAITDNDGRYQFTGLAAGRYMVSNVCPPSGSQWIRLAGWKMRQDASVGEGKTATKDFQLTAGSRLKGRVLDDTGKPIADAAVTCNMDSATEVGPKQMYQMPGQWYSAEAHTDKSGCFVLGALTQETYRVQVHPPEGSDRAWASVRGINALEGQDTALQDVILSKGAAIVGVALGPDGKPIAGAEAVLSPGGSQDTRVCNEKGAFAFKGLPTGKYAVTVNPPEESKWCPTVIAATPAIRGFRVEQRIALPLGASVSGIVTGPDGKPVEGAHTYINYSVGKTGSVGSWRGVTDEAGRFSIPGLGIPPDCEAGGAWQLVISPPPASLELKGMSAPLEAFVSGKPVEKNVQLSAGLAVITGVVSGPDGKPLPGCRMAVVRIKGRGSCTGVCYALKKSDAEGRFAIGQIEPDSWSVTAEPPEGSGLVPLLEPARNLKAGITTVAVTMKKGAAIHGKVLTSTGQPVVAAEVHAKNTAKDREWIPSIAENRLPARTGPDGTFRLAGLQAGQYQVSCQPLNPEYGASEASLTLPAGGEVEAKIGAFRMGRVHGRVSGNNLPQGCYLEFVPQGGELQQRAYPKADGQFSLERIAPGKYTLKVAYWSQGKQGSMANTPKEVSIKEGEDVELQVSAELGGAEPQPKAAVPK